jgi:HEAT repeat protein
MAEDDIPDALPADFPEPPAASPYKNLWVPLVVVPALIVMVLVLVWVLFGSLAGSEKSPAENVQRMVEGSSNEREQASILLVNQIRGYLEDQRAGKETTWELDASFLPEVERALAEVEPDEVIFRYVLAFVLLQLGDPEGVDHLIGLLAASDDEDPGGEVRFLVLHTLGVLGPTLDAPTRAAAVAAVLPFLSSQDPGLRLMATSALQGLPGEESLAALERALGDPALDVRGSAAISLSLLGDPAGADVLRELLDPAAYAAERAVSSTRWASGEQVSATRIQAVHALARLGRAQDLAALEPLARDDEDLNVREAALRALADAPR